MASLSEKSSQRLSRRNSERGRNGKERQAISQITPHARQMVSLAVAHAEANLAQDGRLFRVFYGFRATRCPMVTYCYHEK